MCLLAGGAPLFFGPRALEKLRNRKTKPTSYNLDLNLIGILTTSQPFAHRKAMCNCCVRHARWRRMACIGAALAQSRRALWCESIAAAGDYWGWFGGRSYHHTGMVSLWYATRL